MAVIYCWESGMLGICAAKDRPDGTILIAAGLESKLRTIMTSTARHEPLSNEWYAPGVQDQGEDEKFALVDQYSRKLIERLHKRRLA